MKILFIINSNRRSKPPSTELIDEFHSILAASGKPYRIALSDSIEHARELIATAAAERFDTLWIGGGDGSIHHLFNHSHGMNFTYGIVPMGTINALAKSLEIPLDPVEAVKYLLDAVPAQIDVPQVNGRRFLVFASIGMHAAVIHGVSPELKRRFGRLAFFVSGVRYLFGNVLLRRFRVEMRLRAPTAEQSARQSDDQDAAPRRASGEILIRNGYTMILTNICNYVGFGTVRDEECSSEYLQMHLFRSDRLWPMFQWLLAWRFGTRHQRSGWGVHSFTISECTVRSRRRLFVQVDGEPITFPAGTELRFTCSRLAATILLSPEKRDQNFPHTQADAAAPAQHSIS